MTASGFDRRSIAIAARSALSARFAAPAPSEADMLADF